MRILVINYVFFVHVHIYTVKCKVDQYKDRTYMYKTCQECVLCSDTGYV